MVSLNISITIYYSGTQFNANKRKIKIVSARNFNNFEEKIPNKQMK